MLIFHSFYRDERADLTPPSISISMPYIIFLLSNFENAMMMRGFLLLDADDVPYKLLRQDKK